MKKFFAVLSLMFLPCSFVFANPNATTFSGLVKLTSNGTPVANVGITIRIEYNCGNGPEIHYLDTSTDVNGYYKFSYVFPETPNSQYPADVFVFIVSGYHIDGYPGESYLGDVDDYYGRTCNMSDTSVTPY